MKLREQIIKISLKKINNLVFTLIRLEELSVNETQAFIFSNCLIELKTIATITSCRYVFNHLWK